MRVMITVNSKAIEGSFKGKISRLKTKAGNAVQGAGINCQAGAKQRCPVDTGRLRSSIQYTKLSQLQCKVGTNVKYAKPVEYGHVTRSGSFVAGQPFVFPAAVAAHKDMMIELKSLVDQ